MDHVDAEYRVEWPVSLLFPSSPTGTSRERQSQKKQETRVVRASRGARARARGWSRDGVRRSASKSKIRRAKRVPFKLATRTVRQSPMMRPTDGARCAQGPRRRRRGPKSPPRLRDAKTGDAQKGRRTCTAERRTSATSAGTRTRGAYCADRRRAHHVPRWTRTRSSEPSTLCSMCRCPTEPSHADSAWVDRALVTRAWFSIRQRTSTALRCGKQRRRPSGRLSGEPARAERALGWRSITTGTIWGGVDRR